MEEKWEAQPVTILLEEWLPVTGIFLFTGLMVWTLMVRRRLYKEVEQTRLRVKGVLS